MKTIILCTLNARYSHTSLALRYLYANLHEFKDNALIKEYVIGKNNQEIAEDMLAHQPKIIALGVYIWNVRDIEELIAIIKSVAPETIVILGGPEAGHAPHRVDLDLADYRIKGEGEIELYKLIKTIEQGGNPTKGLICAQAPNLDAIELPYEFYSKHDLQNRYIYVETSRGCPFECEFCLSSIDERVRYFDQQKLLDALQKLWERGARNFKFVDRTFNLNIKKATALMDFFLEKKQEYFLHFEFIPDTFPVKLREKLAQFPPGALQLEVGIQTLNEEVAKRINRPLRMERIKQNLRFLHERTHAHLHLDLIVGLPGESLESFGDNLDLLMSLSRSEIQIGILKKLSGTTLDRHDKKHGMHYSDKPPYDVLQTGAIDFATMQKMKRFARYFDIVYNSGNFKDSAGLLWREGKVFDNFYAFTEWFFDHTRSTWQIGLNRMAEYLFDYLVSVKGLDKEQTAKVMIADLQRVKGRKLPAFLRPFDTGVKKQAFKIEAKNKRQMKHL